MKRIFILFILFSVYYGYTKEHKEIEFSIGCGLTQSFVLSYASCDLTVDGEEQNNTASYYFPYGQTVMVSLPFSFVCYSQKRYGLGFKIDNGFSLLLYSGFGATYFEYIAKLYFVNKFKNPEKQNAFILEYGLAADLQIMNELLMYTFYSKTRYVMDKLRLNFLLGPGMFVGGEFKTRKGFGAVVGCAFEALFYINPEYYETYKYEEKKIVYGSRSSSDNIRSYTDNECSEYFLSYIRIGLEVRFNFVYNKVLN